MSHVTAYSGKQDPINCPANAPPDYKHTTHFEQQYTQPPEPASGEWTTKYVHELMNGIGADARIADEHNAALDDQKRDLWEKISLSRIEADNWKGLYEKQQTKRELESAVDLAIEAMTNENDQLKEQLAAEQATIRKLSRGWSEETDGLQQQLAAEQQKHIVSEGLLIEANKELREQLAAEREKVQLLADALHFYRNHDDNGQWATDALKKIGIT